MQCSHARKTCTSCVVRSRSRAPPRPCSYVYTVACHRHCHCHCHPAGACQPGCGKGAARRLTQTDCDIPQISGSCISMSTTMAGYQPCTQSMLGRAVLRAITVARGGTCLLGCVLKHTAQCNAAQHSTAPSPSGHVQGKPNTQDAISPAEAYGSERQLPCPNR